MTLIEPLLCAAVGGGASPSETPHVDLGAIEFPMPVCPVAVRPPDA